jgi:hypothetical protein
MTELGVYKTEASSPLARIRSPRPVNVSVMRIDL